MVTDRRSVLFRAEASAALGIGHVMRCLTLAAGLTRRGRACRFACSAETIRTVAALRAAPVELVELPEGAGHDPAALTGLEPPHWLVVDHYGLDRSYEQALAAWAEQILVIDDLADRPHHCHILLDQTIGREAAAYDGLVPEGAVVLAGANHALLRPDFVAAKGGGERPLERVLVALGGTDPTDATGIVLDGLDRARLGLPVSVVMGSGAPHLAAVRRRAARLDPPAEVLTDVVEMAALMARCGLAVGAAGTSALERCRMGLPGVVVVIADNQRAVAAGLEQAGAAVVAPLEAAAVAERLAALAVDEALRRRMAKTARALCDGRGVERLAEFMSLELRPLVLADGEDLLVWRNDPVTRANSLDTAPVERERHFDWLHHALADPERLLLMAERDGGRLGMVRFDTCRKGEWRVSISIAPEARGRGIGRVLLALAIQRLERLRGRGVLVAEIRAANDPSRRIFAACGFCQVDEENGVLYYRRDAAG